MTNKAKYPDNHAAFRGIDHVAIRLKDAEPLYDLFSKTLGLPVSWPLQQSDFATFGWVTVGNTNLEFWAASNNSDLPSELVLPAFHGLALDPTDLSSDLSVLAERGIQCKAARTFQTLSEYGQTVANFTNAVVLSLSSASCCVFFCEWHEAGNIFPWKEKLSTVMRQSREQDAMRDCGGGQLGIIGLAEIHLASPTPQKTEHKWRIFAGIKNGPIMLTDAILLRIVPGKLHFIQSLVFRVRSLAEAKNILKEKGLLGTADAKKISLSRSASSGLAFVFIE